MQYSTTTELILERLHRRFFFTLKHSWSFRLVVFFLRRAALCCSLLPLSIFFFLTSAKCVTLNKSTCFTPLPSLLHSVGELWDTHLYLHVCPAWSTLMFPVLLCVCLWWRRPRETLVCKAAIQTWVSAVWKCPTVFKWRCFLGKCRVYRW